MNHSDTVNFESRLTAVEISLSNHSTEIHNLSRAYEDSTRDIFRRFDGIASQLSDNKPIAPKYIAIIATIAIFITGGVFKIIGSGYEKDIARGERKADLFEARTYELRERLYEHIIKGGHIGMEKRMEQREQEGKMFLSWMQDHDERVGGINSGQDEQIKALERKVFKGK